jgi:thiol-disulfide isomerase/thioredoxin
MISNDPYAAIMEGVNGATVVGSEQIDGISTQHLHFTQKDLSWDLWVENGDTPWIRRVAPDVSTILTQFQQPGKAMKMVLNINYTGLANNPDLPISDFVFSPPADAKEVASFFKSPGTEEAENPLAKKPAPPVEIATLDGGKFDLASHKDKDVVIIDFWTTWAPPCRRVLPILMDVAKTYYPKGVQLLAVNEMEDPAKVQQYLNEANLDFNVGLDRSGEVGQAYHVTGLPLTVIIGRDGVVRSIQVGFPADLKEKLSSELDAALAAPPAPAQ